MTYRAMAAVKVVFLLFVVMGSAGAQTNPARLIPFQARLADASGTDVPSGVQDKVTFNIYEQATGGVPCWTELHQNVPIVNGFVNVLLGSITAVDDPNNDSSQADALNFDPAFQACGGTGQPVCLPCQGRGYRYLGITLGNNPQEMVPRHQIVPSFHTRTAGIANAVIDGGVTTNMLADGAVTTNKIAGNAITGAKIATGANGITAANLAPGTIVADVRAEVTRASRIFSHTGGAAPLDVVLFDTNSIHTTPTRLVAPQEGVYDVRAAVRLSRINANQRANVRIVRTRGTATEQIARQIVYGSVTNVDVSLSAQVCMAANDFVELQVTPLDTSDVAVEADGTSFPLLGLSLRQGVQANACRGNCGNGTIDPGEACDDAMLNSKNCKDLGFALGSLGCNLSCAYDTSGCIPGTRVFVTSTFYQPFQLGYVSVPGYDSKCQQLATTAGLGGNWVAWLSTAGWNNGNWVAPTSNAKDRMTSQGPFVRIDGVQIASSRSNLLSGSLLAPINVDEHGNVLTNPIGLVMTGTGTDGNNNNRDCRAWTEGSSGGGYDGRGNPNATDVTWTYNGDFFCQAYDSFRLYCFEN